MRFIAVNAAVMVGMHVAGKMVREGGVKLLSNLTTRVAEERVPFQRSLEKIGAAEKVGHWQSTLLTNYRSLQKTLDTWEGVVRDIDPITGRTLHLDETKAGFFATQAEKERLYNATHGEGPISLAEKALNTAKETGDPEKIAQAEQVLHEASSQEAPIWDWRDTMQRTLVRQGRRLPYELPAMYLTQRAVTDPMMGNDRDRGKWYNPLDVITDFAGSAARQTLSAMVPLEVGSATLKQGWNDLMTYGDFATTTSTFHPHIKQFSLDLRGLLAAVGHDSSQLIYNTIQRSQQFTGAFGSAVDEYAKMHSTVQSRFGIGEIPRIDDIPESYYKTKPGTAARWFEERKATVGKWSANQQLKGGAYARKIWNESARAVKGMRTEGPKEYFNQHMGEPGRGSVAKTFDAYKHWFPRSGIFFDEFKTRWDEGGEGISALEALRADKLHYSWKGDAFSLEANTPQGTRGRTLAARMGSKGTSDVEQLASSLAYIKGQGRDLNMRGQFARGRMQDEYKKILEGHLVDRGVPEPAAKKFVELAKVSVPSTSPVGEAEALFNISQRIGFGEERMVGRTRGFYSEWHRELEGRISGPKVAGQHGVAISRNISDAVKKADIDFLHQRPNIQARITQDWKDAYHKEGGLLDYAKNRLPATKHPFDMFGNNMSSEDEELLVRLAAQHSGVPMFQPYGSPYALNDLREALQRKGFNMSDHYSIRNFLVEKGVVAKPWHDRGFNILGLRPLAVKDALGQHYFKANLNVPIERLHGDIAASVPYVGDEIRRAVGKGVYQTIGGQIIDLSRLHGGIRSAANLAQTHLQVPILGMTTNLFGHGAFRSMAESPMIQYMPGYEPQRFLGEGHAKADSYFWMRQRGSRGRIVAQTSGHGLRQLEGTYRPFSTARHDLLGRTIRLALGDKGQFAPTDDSIKARLNRRFAVDADQPQSLFRFVQRIREGRGDAGLNPFKRSTGMDYNNPATYARWIIEGNIPNDLTKEQLEAFGRFQGHLRKFGVTPQVAQLLEEAQNQRANEYMDFARVMHGVTGGRYKVPESVEDVQTFAQIFRATEHYHPDYTSPPVSLSQVKTADEMFGAVRATIKMHEEYEEALLNSDRVMNYDKVARMRRARGILYDRYLRHEAKPGYLDEPVAQAMHSTGIHRRLDEFRADMYRYLMARQGIMGEGEGVIEELLFNLDNLKAKGQIPPGQYIEAKAAVLSMQLNFQNIHHYAQGVDYADQVRGVLGNLRNGPNQAALRDIADYETEFIHRTGLRKKIPRWARRRTGRADYQYPGTEYNPFGNDTQFVPTFGTAFNRNKLGAIKSVIGLNTWSSPENFSALSVPVSHFYQRLNKYFSTFGLGVDETQFKGPIGFFNKGLVGRRVLPAVAAGSILMAADRTVGGHVRHRDEQGRRRYGGFVTGGIANLAAHGDVALAGVLPGGETAQEKKEELFGDREIAVRKGRWWPLGNQPWKGGRVQYFRPSWYKRMQSGTQYTGQNWDSPFEKLMYGNDFSPGRIIDPYRWERKHASDRPYPVSGEYFTGPWGPATGMLNLTVGQFLKPHVRMHEKEVSEAMSHYQATGEYAMRPPQTQRNTPLVTARNPTGSVGIFAPRSAGEILGSYPSLNAPITDQYAGSYRQPYGFLGMPYGTAPDTAAQSYRNARPVDLGGPVSGRTRLRSRNNRAGNANTEINNYYAARASGPPAPNKNQDSLSVINNYYEDRAKGPRASQKEQYQYDPYNRTVMLNARNFDTRTMPNLKPMSPGSLKYQAGQLGYETQEMFGIYGFLFGQARQSLGFGKADYTPNRPVLQGAGRGYGTERSFWDLNLGGLGDFPNLSEGEYGNMEVSEIARRFIPHRRRDINELNPITNDMGRVHPWLPGDDYFINFKQGDPYAQVPEGELRLPGAAYERTHKLHPDVTGKYGVLDQHSILGDVAPWSQQYKAIDQVVDKLQLSDEDLQLVRQTRKQVAAVNKRHEFHPYKYAHTDFRTAEAEVTGLKSDYPHVLRTTAGDIRLAGVRGRSGPESRLFMEGLLEPGTKIHYTYDFNRPSTRGSPLDAVVEANGTNINKALLRSDYGYEAQTENPVDYLVTQNVLKRKALAVGETLTHRNTMLNNKFMPYRSAVEDWERMEVYGTSFPQWQHPFRDFVKPLGFRAMNRNPFIAAAALGTMGRLFMRTPEAKAVGTFAGAATGFGIAAFTDANAFDTGQRYVPIDRRKQMAVDEYTDVLNYVKFSKAYSQARNQAMETEHTDPESISKAIERGKFKNRQYANLGPATANALAFRRSIKQTMYGADVYGDVMDLASAIPKRKRDHFMEFINAPLDERPRILSTAPRLERRIYEARWGMKVERRPDLVSYFSGHELPSTDWEGWDPNVDSDTIKLKIAQSQGIDASQMGYFPQQIEQANLLNPSYPDFHHRSRPHAVAAQLRELMRSSGASGHVIAVPSAVPGSRVQLSAGVS